MLLYLIAVLFILFVVFGFVSSHLLFILAIVALVWFLLTYRNRGIGL